MDLLVPPHGILQPLSLGKAQRGFNLGTDISLADPSVEICHEDNGRKLLEKRAVLGLKIGKLSGRCRLLFRRLNEMMPCAWDLNGDSGVSISKAGQNRFRFVRKKRLLF